MKNEKKSLKVTVGYGPGDAALESALSTFKKKVNDAGVYEDYMRTQEFEKPSQRRRRKAKASQRKYRKAERERNDNVSNLLYRCVVR